MKKWIVAPLAALTLIMMGECAMADPYMTPERLLTMAGLTEQDVDATILPEFIKRFGVTEESLAGAPQEELRQELLEALGSNYLKDYRYLFDGITPELADTVGFSSIERVAVYNRMELITEAAFFDLQDGMIYADGACWFFDDIETASLKVPLDKKHRAELEKQMMSCNFSEWSAATLAGNRENAICAIAFETDAGVCCCALSQNMDNENARALLDAAIALLTLAIGD